MKVSPLGSCRFEKGDWVEIVGNIPFPLKDKPRPIIGRVTHVNGEKRFFHDGVGIDYYRYKEKN